MIVILNDGYTDRAREFFKKHGFKVVSDEMKMDPIGRHWILDTDISCATVFLLLFKFSTIKAVIGMSEKNEVEPEWMVNRI